MISLASRALICTPGQQAIHDSDDHTVDSLINHAHPLSCLVHAYACSAHELDERASKMAGLYTVWVVSLCSLLRLNRL